MDETQLLIQMLDNMIQMAIDTLEREIMANGPESESIQKAMRKLDFRIPKDMPNDDDYRDPIFCAYYLTRYGYAYAFEYAVLYDAIIRNYSASEACRQNGNQGESVLGVSTMACGSMIDAWGLAYAYAKIREEGEADLPENLNLRYHGTDLNRWGFYFAGEDPGFDGQMNDIDETVNNLFEIKPRLNKFDEQGLGQDIVQFINSEKNYSWLNVHTFAKVLNEIPDQIPQIAMAFREAVNRGDFVGERGRQEYYICISHSHYGVHNDINQQNLVEQIVDAINFNNCFDVNAEILECSSLFGTERGIEKRALENAGFPIYVFRRDEGNIGCKIRDIDNRFGNLFSQIEDFDRDNLSGFENYKHSTQRVTGYSFQIVKLTRRQ